MANIIFTMILILVLTVSSAGSRFSANGDVIFKNYFGSIQNNQQIVFDIACFFLTLSTRNFLNENALINARGYGKYWNLWVIV